MDGNLYDEFGNYIGPEVDLSDEEEDAGDDWMDRAEAAADARLDATVRGDDDEAGSDADEDEDEEDRSRAVTLAEDKKYYPTAEEVYGADTETLVETEDAQPLEEPIVAPVKVKNIEASGQRMTGGSVGAQARAQDSRVRMRQRARCGHRRSMASMALPAMTCGARCSSWSAAIGRAPVPPPCPPQRRRRL